MTSVKPRAGLFIRSAEKLIRSQSPTPAVHSPSNLHSPTERCRGQFSTIFNPIDITCLTQTPKTARPCLVRRFSDPMCLPKGQKEYLSEKARKQFQIENTDLNNNENDADDMYIGSGRTQVPLGCIYTGIALGDRRRALWKKTFSADDTFILREENEEQTEEAYHINTEHFTRKSGHFTSKILETKEHIMAAQKLLYDVYVDEGGWMFDEENPTGFRTERHNGESLLIDDLEGQAIWFGAFHKSRLISCIRMIKRNKEGILDINRYSDSNKPHLKTILQNEKLVEVQRCAIDPEFRGIGVMALTLSLVAQYARYNNVDIVGSTPMNNFKNLLVQCQGQVIDENFDYGDGVATTVLYWRKSILTTSLNAIEGLIRKHPLKEPQRENQALTS